MLCALRPPDTTASQNITDIFIACLPCTLPCSEIVAREYLAIAERNHDPLREGLRLYTHTHTLMLLDSYFDDDDGQQRVAPPAAAPSVWMSLRLATRARLGITMTSTEKRLRPPLQLMGDVELKSPAPTVITAVEEGCAAMGVLLIGDLLTHANHARIMGSTHASSLIGRAIADEGHVVIELLRPSPALVVLTAAAAEESAHNVHVDDDARGGGERGGERGVDDGASSARFGLSVALIDGDVRVISLDADGPAMRSGQLCVGCRIISAGGEPCVRAAQVASAVQPDHQWGWRLELSVAHRGVAEGGGGDGGASSCCTSGEEDRGVLPSRAPTTSESALLAAAAPPPPPAQHAEAAPAPPPAAAPAAGTLGDENERELGRRGRPGSGPAPPAGVVHL